MAGGPQISTDSHRIGLERREGAVLTNRLHQAARPEQLGLAQVCHQGLQPLEHPATSWHIPAKSRLLHVRSIPDASRSTGTGLLHALHGRVALHGQERLLHTALLLLHKANCSPQKQKATSGSDSVQQSVASLAKRPSGTACRIITFAVCSVLWRPSRRYTHVAGLTTQLSMFFHFARYCLQTLLLPICR